MSFGYIHRLFIVLSIKHMKKKDTESYGYTTSEKKKSLFIGGGPGTNPLGISTISPDRSATTMSI